MGTHHLNHRHVASSSAAALLAAASLLALEGTRTSATAAEPARPPAYVAPGYPFPPLSPRLPFDVDNDEVRSLVREGDIVGAHRLFSNLSWQAFIALNWPAAADGTPDRTKNMSDSTSWRVWNYWRSSGSIFLPEGKDPAPWTDELQRPANLRSVANQTKTPGKTALRDNFEAFTGPLVDQNGKWARFEIRINKEEFDYIYSNHLYSQDGQVAFSHREKDNQVEMPVNGGGSHGAIELKFAWKELGPKDDPSRFYVTDLDVTPSEPEGFQPNPKRLHVGLVGMHIAMRTQSSPEWIWSTFEQIDNVRVNPGAKHPNFFNPSSSAPVNQEPAKNAVTGPNGLPVAPVPPTATASTWIESLTTTPTQATRVDVPTVPQLNPLDKQLGAVAAKLNAEVQAKLRDVGSVFQYYELIDTQWPLHPNAPAVAGGEGSAPESIRFKTPGEMIPVFLINTTMETYFQTGPQPAGGSEQDNRLGVPSALLSDEGKKQVSQFGGLSLTDSTRIFGTESCVGCHYSSGIAIAFRKDKDGNDQAIFGENNHFGKTGGANFSWMLQLEAQKKPATPKPAGK